MPPTSKTLAERCAGIEMLVLDVDGVLTDGSIIYSDSGPELKKFFVRDGAGLKIWHAQGKRAAIITGRSSRVVEIRAAELDIEPVIQGAADKLQGVSAAPRHGGRQPRAGLCGRRRPPRSAALLELRPGGYRRRCLRRGKGSRALHYASAGRPRRGARGD